MNARPYESLQDLNAMLDLLTAGAQANNGTHYVHRGDLQWWLFYSDIPLQTWLSHIRLWFEEDRLVGWSLLSKEEQFFDVYVAPRLRGSSSEREMLDWAVEQMSAIDHLETIWIAEDDDVRVRWLDEHGFKPEPRFTQYFKRSLSGPLNAPPLPEGFSIRHSRGAEDARLRAACSHAAFGSEKPFEEYWLRALRFMQSPVYIPEHELFVIAPTGEVAAFCIVWIDELTKVGHFEPVGTHPNFQRKGLGKSLLFEALRRLKSEGMTAADVCTNHDNEAAIPLYESVGFQKSRRLLTLSRKK